MKQIIIFLIVSLLVVGCGKKDTSDIKVAVDKVVKNAEFSEVLDKLESSISKIYITPSLESEDEFIYYVLAIKDNLSRFSKEELSKIYEKLQIEYGFEYNSLSYNTNLYDSDVETIYNFYNGTGEDLE